MRNEAYAADCLFGQAVAMRCYCRNYHDYHHEAVVIVKFSTDAGAFAYLVVACLVTI